MLLSVVSALGSDELWNMEWMLCARAPCQNVNDHKEILEQRKLSTNR